MTNKRIILEIPASTHEKIKNFAIKDKRTMTTVLRIMIEEIIDKLIDDKEKQHNSICQSSNETHHNHINETGRSPMAELELKEIKEYGRILTDEERAYLAKNPLNKLREF